MLFCLIWTGDYQIEGIPAIEFVLTHIPYCHSASFINVFNQWTAFGFQMDFCDDWPP